MKIKMVVEAYIAEDVGTLYAHKSIANRISLMVSDIDWVQQVRIISEL